jgi:glc operon protein GlcG
MRDPMPFAASHRLTTEGAKAMLAAAVSRSEDLGIAVTVAIVDAGGHLMVLERMDGGLFHTVHSSMTKAVTSASNKRPTTTRGAQGQDLDTVHAIGLSLAAGPDRWTAMEGGFPILVEGECVGGIGVSGGDWQQDEAIAQAALAAVNESQEQTNG